MTRNELINRIAKEASELGYHAGIEAVERVYHLLSMDEIDELRQKIWTLDTHRKIQ